MLTTEQIVFALPPFVSGVISLLLLPIAWKRRRLVPAAVPFSAFLLAAALWSLLNTAESLSTTLPAKIALDNLQYHTADACAFSALVFALMYVGRQETGRKVAVFLGVVALVNAALVWTDPLHHLIRIEPAFLFKSTICVLTYDYGPLAYFMFIVALASVAGAMLIIAQSLDKTNRYYTLQTALVVLGLGLPWFGALASLFELTPPIRRDIFPLVFGVSNLIIAFGLFRQHLFTTPPTAYATLVHNMPDGVIVLDRHTHIIDLNPAAESIIGSKLKDVVGLPFANIRHSGELWIKQVTAANPDGAIVIQEIDGKRCFYSVETTPLKDHGSLILLKDITLYKEAEHNLTEREARLKALLENTTDYILAVDRDYRVIALNTPMKTAYKQFFDIDIAAGDMILEQMPDAFRKIWQSTYDRAFAGEVFSFEETFEMDGVPIVQEVLVTPITINGEITGATVFSRNITERKVAERDRIEYQLLNRYVGDITHDLTNPISALSTNMFLLHRTEPSAEQNKLLERLEEQVSRMQAIVNSMRMVSQLYSPRDVPYNMASLKIDDLISEVVVQFKPLAASSSIELTYTPAPGAVVHADRDYLTRVIENLLDNAIKFTAQGGAVNIVTLQENQHVEIRVEDSGKGITPDVLPYIFEPFYRGEAHRPGNGSSGLGLAIARKIVEDLGGSINVSSTDESGTAFVVQFPHKEHTRTASGTPQG